MDSPWILLLELLAALVTVVKTAPVLWQALKNS
jgi:hypothetical protein